MAVSSYPLLLLLLTVLSSRSLLATDVEWYISSTGSANITSCGHSPDTPCNSLQTILDQSPQFNNGSVICYLSSGATDGRDSTTLYFMGEVNSVPPVCLMNWQNVRVVGLDSNNIITGGRFGAQRGIFEFISCSNISINGLNFATTPIGKSILFFEACRDITITNSSFPLVSIASRGVQMLQCSGVISLFRDLFYGDPEQTTQDTHPLGLDITHGCPYCTLPFSDVSYNFSALSFSLTIRDCIFQDIANRSPPEDNYASSRETAAAMRLQFNERSANNRVVITGSTFRRIFNSESNGVLVSYNEGTVDNSVLVEQCTFQGNHVRYGGGVAVYFYSGPLRNALEIRGCNFTGNEADFEGGGVFAVLLNSGADNSIVISNSTFFNNSAEVGSGIFLLNNPLWFRQRGVFDPTPFSLVPVELRDCVFQENVASLYEGVVNSLRAHLNISGVR